MLTRGINFSAEETAFIQAIALLYGKVRIGKGASVFPYVVMRSQLHEIRIGPRTNIQDFVMIHVGAATPTIVGGRLLHHASRHTA